MRRKSKKVIKKAKVAQKTKTPKEKPMTEMQAHMAR
jgi:hypothetical protein